jgi:thiol-disulfide isomerase/thioredoxin
MLLGVAVWLVSPVLPSIVPMLAWAGLLIFSAIYLHALDPLPPTPRLAAFLEGRGRAGADRRRGAVHRRPGRLPRPAAAAGHPARPGRQRAPAAETKFQRVRSVEELDQILKTATRPVMLDFYADWCISCKEMERFTFADPAVAAARGFQLLQADVTANNEADKALLKRFKLFGPPGIIFFDAAGAERTGLRGSASRPRGLRQGRWQSALQESAKPDIIRASIEERCKARVQPAAPGSMSVPAKPPRRQPRSPVHALFANPCRARGDAVSHLKPRAVPPGHTFEEIS